MQSVTKVALSGEVGEGASHRTYRTGVSLSTRLSVNSIREGVGTVPTGRSQEQHRAPGKVTPPSSVSSPSKPKPPRKSKAGGSQLTSEGRGLKKQPHLRQAETRGEVQYVLFAIRQGKEQAGEGTHGYA